MLSAFTFGVAGTSPATLPLPTLPACGGGWGGGKRSKSSLAALFVLHGLALGRYGGPHAAPLPHPHAVGDLDLDLIVVHHLGHLSDQSARGDEDVAAAHILHHLLVLLCPLLLRPQDEEIHDDENKAKRQQLIKHVRPDPSHPLS